MLASKRRMELRSSWKCMSCFVGLADSTVLEVDFTPQSDGLEILTKVCSMLGIVETDYFGLMYHSGRKGDELWLNLRNRVCQEVAGSLPYRLEFRVKFYVPAHMIQQDATRHQFYLNICESYIAGKLRVSDRCLIAHITALIVHTETRDRLKTTRHQLAASCDIHRLSEHELSYTDWLPVGSAWHTDFELASLITAQLTMLTGVSKSAAEYRLIQTVDSLEMYGATYHSSRNSAGVTISIAATSSGVVFFSDDWTQLNSVPYAAIQRVTNDGSSLLMETTSDDGAVSRQHLKLSSRLLANALYRAMTENYYFYQCDTVGRAVLLQSSRDLKGTLASLFNENTEMGKTYVFDIQRTMREAYDRARRILHQSETESESPPLSDDNSPTHKSSRIDNDAVTVATTSLSYIGHRGDCPSTCTCFLTVQESIAECRESLRCQLCADASVDVAFVPCGHVTCCMNCAPRLDDCPLCKTTITQRLKIYLPCHSFPASR